MMLVALGAWIYISNNFETLEYCNLNMQEISVKINEQNGWEQDDLDRLAQLEEVCGEIKFEVNMPIEWDYDSI